jgi:hypothetical protein
MNPPSWFLRSKTYFVPDYQARTVERRFDDLFIRQRYVEARKLRSSRSFSFSAGGDITSSPVYPTASRPSLPI